MEKLAAEISANSSRADFVDSLQFYIEKYAPDGVIGLEAKLTHAGRASEVSLAMRKKELFSRMLVKYQMFESAQKILAYLLSKLESDFNAHILPSIADKNRQELDAEFQKYLVTPCANEIKEGVFNLDFVVAAGMVYWLAEQCYIRWHK